MIDTWFTQQRYATGQRSNRSAVARAVWVTGLRLPDFLRHPTARRNLVVQLLLLLVIFNSVASVSQSNLAHALDHDRHPSIATESEHFGAHHNIGQHADDDDEPLTAAQHELLHAMTHVQLFIHGITLDVFSVGAAIMPVLLIICAVIYKPSETPFRPPRNH